MELEPKWISKVREYELQAEEPLALPHRQVSGRSFAGFSVRDFCLSDSASNRRSVVRDRLLCGR